MEKEHLYHHQVHRRKFHMDRLNDVVEEKTTRSSVMLLGGKEFPKALKSNLNREVNAIRLMKKEETQEDKVVRRTLINISQHKKQPQRKNHFRTTCKSHGKICKVIVDSGSTKNIVSRDGRKVDVT